MPHHYTKSTVEVSVYCPTCNKETPHYVADGRLGRCKNDHHPIAAKAEIPKSKQGDLFK